MQLRHARQVDKSIVRAIFFIYSWNIQKKDHYWHLFILTFMNRSRKNRFMDRRLIFHQVFDRSIEPVPVFPATSRYLIPLSKVANKPVSCCSVDGRYQSPIWNMFSSFSGQSPLEVPLECVSVGFRLPLPWSPVSLATVVPLQTPPQAWPLFGHFLSASVAPRSYGTDRWVRNGSNGLQVVPHLEVETCCSHFHRGVFSETFHRIHNWTIASTTADISVKNVLNVLHGNVPTGLAFHKSRRSKYYHCLYIGNIVRSYPCTDMTIPGLQKPHWEPFPSANCVWIGW